MFKSILVVLFTVFALYSRNHGDHHYFAAGTVGWHQRLAFIDFGNDKIEKYKQKLLRTQGVALGKNLPLPLNLRISLPLIFEYGSVEDDLFENVPLTNGTTPNLVLYSKMYHAGFIPLCQMPLRNTSSIWPVIALGCGVHYVAFIEEFRLEDNPRYYVTDEYLEESKGFSFSIAGGGGFEMKLGSRFMLSLQYLFRFWKPVERKMARDLFPLEKIPYHEKFFSHTVSVAFMVPRVTR